MEKCLQEQYAPHNECYGCGPSNKEGVHVRSFAKGKEVVAEWTPTKKFEAFPGVLNGGIIGTLLDCHCNWTACYSMMVRDEADSPPCTVTADYSIRLTRPSPSDGPVQLRAWVTSLDGDKAVIEGELTAKGKVCATCKGTFVAVRAGHPAYHRW